MKALWKKKEFILIGVVVILFTLVSYLSFVSINQMRGNARVVNYAGIVRGATQRLVKKELQNHPDDALIARLDSIIEDLIHGGGSNRLVALGDKAYQDNMAQVRQSWNILKKQILQVRNGSAEDANALFVLSEDYFNLVDRTVSSAEAASEQQVDRSTKLLLAVNAVFVVIILAGILSFLRSTQIKKHADVLNKMAYLDALTQMPNRASCEREVDRYVKDPVTQSLAAFMFDMNNLKRANDQLGHQGGDRLIADFSRILKTESQRFGFVGRYGGDEFVALFPDCTHEKAEQYLTQINEKIVSYNLLHIHEVEKISFAAGYVIGNPTTTTVLDMIHDADAKMYLRKRQMKENKEA